MQFIYTVNIPLGVFGTGQLFLETMKTETVVDTLTKNTARLVFPFQHENGSRAGLPDEGKRNLSIDFSSTISHPVLIVDLSGSP